MGQNRVNSEIVLFIAPNGSTRTPSLAPRAPCAITLLLPLEPSCRFHAAPAAIAVSTRQRSSPAAVCVAAAPPRAALLVAIAALRAVALAVLSLSALRGRAQCRIAAAPAANVARRFALRRWLALAAKLSCQAPLLRLSQQRRLPHRAPRQAGSAARRCQATKLASQGVATSRSSLKRATLPTP